MTKREQAKVDALTRSMRELLAHALALPFDLQPTDAIVRARQALATVEEKEEKKSKRDPVWPSTAFWHAAYTVLAFTDDTWGHKLAKTWRVYAYDERGRCALDEHGDRVFRDITIDPTWHRARLTLKATGGEQTRC